ncbi:uncharacterized protein LOC130621724 isoform X2 [Hydractinia symbiolongicarpus]|nr:uncharacterized protein LOC130621724 isoform X2 [Hydractinia symbiolongicarpus]
MYNDVQKSFDGCWTVTGTKNRPVIPQIITPNITWFQYNGTEVYTGAMTTKWTYQYYAYGMRNHQTFWVTKAKPHRPIRYEMYGYDMMLGSYYDHYVLEYITFEIWNGDEEIFELPQGIQCYNWTNSLSSSLIANPMQEFTAFTPDNAINAVERYEEYKIKHNKSDIASEEESKKRHHIFKHNIRYIHSHNRKNESFKLKENHFLDMSKEELAVYHGSLEKDTKKHKGIIDIAKHEKHTERSSPPNEDDIPDEVDWRDFGAVSHVKGQGICGSCYAITAAGAAEGAWYRQTGRLVEVSPQQLVDCSWGYGNHGCKGGHYAAALSWIYVHGISTDKSYGKYLGQEGYCHFNDTWFGAKIDGFAYIQPWNKTALKRAVAKYGPVAVSVNAAPLSFQFYSHGVYSDPKCSPNHTHHSALVIGYGNQNGQDYWLLKNSWSNTWGENGYIKISMDNDLCGVTEYPVAVVVHHPQFRMSPKIKIEADLNSDDRDKGKQKLKSDKSKANQLLKPHKEDVSAETDLSENPPKKPKMKTSSTEVGSMRPKMPVANKTTRNVSHDLDSNQSQNNLKIPNSQTDTTTPGLSQSPLNKPKSRPTQKKLKSKHARKPASKQSTHNATELPMKGGVSKDVNNVSDNKAQNNHKLKDEEDDFDESEKPTEKQEFKTTPLITPSPEKKLHPGKSEKVKLNKDADNSSNRKTPNSHKLQDDEDDYEFNESKNPTQKQESETTPLATSSQKESNNINSQDLKQSSQKKYRNKYDEFDDDNLNKPTQKATGYTTLNGLSTGKTNANHQSKNASGDFDEDESNEPTKSVNSDISTETSTKPAPKYKSRNKEDDLDDLDPDFHKTSTSEDEEELELNLIKNKPTQSSRDMESDHMQASLNNNANQSMTYLTNSNVDVSQLYVNQTKLANEETEGDIYDLGSEQPTLPAHHKTRIQTHGSEIEGSGNLNIARNVSELNNEVMELRKFLSNYKLNSKSHGKSLNGTDSSAIRPGQDDSSHQNPMPIQSSIYGTQNQSRTNSQEVTNFDKSQNVTSSIESKDVFTVAEKALFGLTQGAAVLSVSLGKKNDDSPRQSVQATKPVKPVSRLPFVGLHIMDAHTGNNENTDEIEDMETISRSELNTTEGSGHTDESENIEENKSNRDSEAETKPTSFGSTTKAKKFPADQLPPILQYAGNLYHQVLKDERYQANDREKQNVLTHQKHIHHIVKKMEDAAAYITTHKPTLNPENVGMYGNEDKPSIQPKRPTILGTKKYVISRATESINTIRLFTTSASSNTNNNTNFDDSSLFGENKLHLKVKNKNKMRLDDRQEGEGNGDTSSKYNGHRSTNYKGFYLSQEEGHASKNEKDGRMILKNNSNSGFREKVKAESKAKEVKHRKKEAFFETAQKEAVEKSNNSKKVTVNERSKQMQKGKSKTQKHFSENKKQLYNKQKSEVAKEEYNRGKTLAVAKMSKHKNYHPIVKTYENSRRKPNHQKKKIKNTKNLAQEEKNSLITLNKLENKIGHAKHNELKSKNTTKKNKNAAKLSNLEKAAKESMTNLYSRIDKMVAEKRKRDEKITKNSIANKKNTTNQGKKSNASRIQNYPPNTSLNVPALALTPIQQTLQQNTRQEIVPSLLIKNAPRTVPQNYTMSSNHGRNINSSYEQQNFG